MITVVYRIRTSLRHTSQRRRMTFQYRTLSLISLNNVPRWQCSWGQHGPHLGPIGPRWVQCWPHELFYQGSLLSSPMPFWSSVAREWINSRICVSKRGVTINIILDGVITTLIGSWGQHGAHLGPTGPRWAPCWPHDLCYLGTTDRIYNSYIQLISLPTAIFHDMQLYNGHLISNWYGHQLPLEYYIQLLYDCHRCKVGQHDYAR